jgi:hypothetical protein
MSFSKIFSHLKKLRTRSRNIDQVVLCTRSFNLLKNFKGVFEFFFLLYYVKHLLGHWFWHPYSYLHQ